MIYNWNKTKGYVDIRLGEGKWLELKIHGRSIACLHDGAGSAINVYLLTPELIRRQR